VAARRQEDLAAMEVLGCEARWLEFTDHQYEPPERRPSPADVASCLRPAIEQLQPTAVFLPMGLANPDHALAHEAGLLVRAELAEAGGQTSWFCYEDAGYKHLPGLLAWRVSKLFRSGLWPTPSVVPVELDMARKRRAIGEYASQLGPLQRDHLLQERLDANVPEQYWRLDQPPAGWERLSSADDLSGTGR
ncbi:MAG TPA: PIG-L family deacetylase, partial [Acidimicrobiales bacterium]|jgi:LmbE family N-acetylglucosaminyl deacetylase|nr:PIG-L family deacetylase [Acidimicrobiales bacterium]